MENRIVGFDLARAYAIFGMFIVNFNYSFGSIMEAAISNDSLAWFMSLFTGNSTAIFIICAGMGTVLMCNKSDTSVKEKQKIKTKILKRSWFLFALGLLLYNWWRGDILHFYGGYMHIAAFIVFLPSRFYLFLFTLILLIHNILLFYIPIETGWDFSNYNYTDFWSIKGFFRNSIYNGWNSIFPWFSYFVLGMWLGKLNWNNIKTKQYIFVSGAILFCSVQILRFFAKKEYFNGFWNNYILSEYFPPYLPFIIITTGFALMMLTIFMFIGERYSNNKVILALQKTGKMTLSHYVIHLTLGVLVLQWISKKEFTYGLLPVGESLPSIYILTYAIVFYTISVIFSIIWSKKYKNGPLETLMRKISG